jgi:hypothetical protein
LQDWKFYFNQKKASSMKQADIRDMFRKASNNECASTVIVSPDPCLLLHQLVQLQRPQKIQKGILMTLNQQMKEVSK